MEQNQEVMPSCPPNSWQAWQLQQQAKRLVWEYRKLDTSIIETVVRQSNKSNRTTLIAQK